MTVSISDQYSLQFSCSTMSAPGFDDLIDGDQLIKFKIVENAGNILPSWELEFITENNNVPAMCQENHNIFVTFGGNSILSFDYTAEFKISAYKFEKLNTSSLLVKLWGLSAFYDYLYLPGDYCKKQSGMEAAIATASKHFTVADTLLTSQDTQVWNQGGRTSKQFIDELIAHSWIEDSWVNVAIGHWGGFFMYDMKARISEGTSGDAFNWSQTGEGVKFVTAPIFSGRPGYLNALGGYDRNFWMYDQEKGGPGDFTDLKDVNSLLAMDAVPNRAELKEKLFKGNYSLNPNVHEKYWEAMQQYLMYSTAYSSNKVVVSFSFDLIAAPLDIVMLNFDPADTSGSINTQSGYWIIGDIVRTIENRQFSCTCHLYREALNNNGG